MAQQIINIGTTENDGTGDKLRIGFDKVNDNFTEIYNNTNVGTNISVSGNTFTSLNTNGQIILSPAGTGTIELQANTNVTGVFTIDQLSFNGNNISSNVSNADIEFTPIGTGLVVIRNGGLDLNNNNITNVTSITSTTFVGSLTGNADTATSSTTASTVTTAAQPTITSLGSLTNLSMSGDIALGANNITGGGAATFTTYTGTLVTPAQPNITSLGTLTSLTSTGNITGKELAIQGNQLVSLNTNANIELLPSGTGTIELLTTTNITGNLIATGSLGGTLTTAAQPNITSIGTLTTLTVGQITLSGNNVSTNITNADLELRPSGTGNVSVFSDLNLNGNSLTNTVLSNTTIDNINISGNTISSTIGNINLIPFAGSQILLDGTISIDAGVVTGATSITSTVFVGDLTGNTSGTAATVTGAAQSNITSLGTLTVLNVDNIAFNTNTISTTTGDLIIAPNGTSNVNITKDLVVDGTTSLGQITILGNNITTNVTNANIELNPAGTGVVEFRSAQQTTVGAAGSASAIPSNPDIYFTINVNGNNYVVPGFAVV